LHVEVTPVAYAQLASTSTAEPSTEIRNRVIAARSLQAERFQTVPGIYANAQMNANELKKICLLNEEGQTLLKKAMERLNLSARAYDRILKVARTIADLASSEKIMTEHIAEAIQYRNLDREGWGG